MKASAPPEGFCDRGLKVKLYPTPEQRQQLLATQEGLRLAYNYLAWRERAHIGRTLQYAQDAGAIGPQPERPSYEGLEPTAAKERKKQHIDACKERRKEGLKFVGAVVGAYGVVAKLEPKTRRSKTEEEALASAKELVAKKPEPPPQLPFLEEAAKDAGHKHDYQLLAAVIRERGYEGPMPCAHQLQAIAHFCRKVKGRKDLRMRRDSQTLPLAIRSRKDMLRYAAPDRWMQVEARFPGVKGPIRGRAGGRPLEWLKAGHRMRDGISIVREADGWYASVRAIVPVPVIPEPEPGTVIGIDPGIRLLAAFSKDLEPVPNPRTHAHVAMVASLQQAIRKTEGKERERLRDRKARIERRMQRRVRHTCCRVARVLEKYEYVGIEENHGIAVTGHAAQGFTRTLVALLKEKRLPGSVLEVPAYNNSQGCCKCGHKDPKALQNDEPSEIQVADGRAWETRPFICQNPSCGFRSERDHNGAGNVENRLVDELAGVPYRYASAKELEKELKKRATDEAEAAVVAERKARRKAGYLAIRACASGQVAAEAPGALETAEIAVIAAENVAVKKGKKKTRRKKVRAKADLSQTVS